MVQGAREFRRDRSMSKMMGAKIEGVEREGWWKGGREGGVGV